jgi:hypothetical protein
MRIERFQDIPLDNLVYAAPEIPVLHFRAYVSQLADMIAEFGLFEPIIVALINEKGKYEIVTGLNRFLAVESLGWPTISAGILDQPLSKAMAKAISRTISFRSKVSRRARLLTRGMAAREISAAYPVRHSSVLPCRYP